jgi:hypothetical protein
VIVIYVTYRIEKKITQTSAKIEKMQRDIHTKEDLKTVALGTSKINYLDPRISVAWCKRHEVPIEKVWTSSLVMITIDFPPIDENQLTVELLLDFPLFVCSLLKGRKLCCFPPELLPSTFLNN